MSTLRGSCSSHPLSAGLAAAAALLTGGPAAAASFVVGSTADTVDATPGDGVCADAAGACTLRAAVQEANALAGADGITLGTGTYALSRAGFGEDLASTGDLDVRDDLTVRGVGAGSTVVDGSGLDRVFHVVTSDTDLSVDNLTIKGGYADDTVTPTRGGAIYLYGYPSAGHLSVTNCVITGNTAYDGSNAWGGGIATADYATVTLTDSEVSYNAATGSTNDIGGGMLLGYYSVAEIARTTFVGNSADQGGGLYTNGDATIVDSAVESNSAEDGAGVYIAYFDVAIEGSTIASNATTGDSGLGGGIYSFSADLTLLNTTVSGNTAARGGGIYASYGSLDLSHATVARNAATRDRASAGVNLESGAAGTAWMTVLARNGNGRNSDCRGTFTSLGYNLLGSRGSDATPRCNGFTAAGDQVGSTASPIDPRLGPLGDHGGPTATHDLLDGSPALDAGDPSDATTEDQRGEARPRDGDGDGVATPDIGAYERGGCLICD